MCTHPAFEPVFLFCVYTLCVLRRSSSPPPPRPPPLPSVCSISGPCVASPGESVRGSRSNNESKSKFLILLFGLLGKEWLHFWCRTFRSPRVEDLLRIEFHFYFRCHRENYFLSFVVWVSLLSCVFDFDFFWAPFVISLYFDPAICLCLTDASSSSSS